MIEELKKRFKEIRDHGQYADSFEKLCQDAIKTAELFEAKIHIARTLWCDSKRNPETGYVDVKYLDEFENAIQGKANGGIR